MVYKITMFPLRWRFGFRIQVNENIRQKTAEANHISKQNNLNSLKKCCPNMALGCVEMR